MCSENHSIKCHKCNGTGFIPGFVHVSEGRCFDCNGTGVLIPPKKATVRFSRSFILQFEQRGYCPPVDDSTEMVACIGFEGHKTAEQWVMRKDDNYIIGQPFCGGSGWYIIPIDEMENFCIHFNKVYRKNIEV